MNFAQKSINFKDIRVLASVSGVIIAFVAIPLTVFLVLNSRQLQTPAASTVPSFSDDFNGAALAAGWQWKNASGNASFNIASGKLNLVAAHGDDQWVNIDRASKVLRASRAGNWTIETRIAGNTASAFGPNFTGLIVYKDNQNWFMWGQLGNASLEGSGLVWNGAIGPVATMSTKYNYVRIRKVGQDYFLDASGDGANWTNANSWHDPVNGLAGASYGFMAKDWSGGVGASYTVSFDYFREYAVDLAPSTLTGTSATVQIVKEIGSGAINNTAAVDICGSDLGSMFDWLGKTYFVFGDTSKCPLSTTTLDRSNVLASSTDANPADGISFGSWISSAGRAKELFDQDPGAVTVIPTYGVGVGATAYLYYMQVTNWGQAGTWTCNYSSIATSTNGQNWQKQGGIVWGPGNFNQVAVVKQDPYLYIWGIPCGRKGSVKLARVSQGSSLNKAAYQYFSGFDSSNNPLWRTNNEAAAVAVVGGPTGEVSVIYNPWLGRYTMSYLEDYSSRLLIREAPNPWGPWSAPVLITDGNAFPGLYGAFMKTGYWVNNGETVYFMMSKFFPDYATYWMKTTLKKSTVSPPPPPPPKATSATNLRVGSQQCVADGVKATFNWTRGGEVAGQSIDAQWLDLSTANNGFQAGTFKGASNPPMGADNSYVTSQGTIGSLTAGTTYFWRINTHFTNGTWLASPTATFTAVPCNPTPASNLTVSSQLCAVNGVKVTFNWTLASGAGKTITDQWLDLSTVGSSFAAGTFIGAHLTTSQISFIAQDGSSIGPLVPAKTHWYRINTNIGGNWYPAVSSFVTKVC